VVGVGGVEDLPAVYDLLTRNRAKHGVRPTHTLRELQRIFELVPKRVQLFTCLAQGTLIAGSIVFELNERVAYSFYPCHDAQFESFRPATALAVGMANHYISRAFKYLDLGPSSFDDYSLNPGLARFKEEIGAMAFCRDTWQWQVPAAGEAVPATSRSERR
jgi:hypothetical protein